MACRKVPLEVDTVYHVCSKSIAGYEIFRNISEFDRMVNLVSYYNQRDLQQSYSDHIRYGNSDGHDIIEKQEGEDLLKIIAYCIMPTHLHLLLMQKSEWDITNYMRKILNSYSHYFNRSTKRKGPLWEGKFKNIKVENDDQLLHLTRYLHLNPSTSYDVKKPEHWVHSSYLEYLGKVDNKKYDLRL